MIRTPAVAGTWYPGEPAVLTAEIDHLLSKATSQAPFREARAILVPHAGLMYSGAVAAEAFHALGGCRYDVVVLLGPSHYVAFDGVACWPGTAFRTPLGDLATDGDLTAALRLHSPLFVPRVDAHRQEHALELQLPFLAALLPDVPIVPLVMGRQARETIVEAADALSAVCAGRRPLLLGSSDLSHFFDAATADVLDGATADLVGAFDHEGLLDRLESYPQSERGRYVMCGGGPAVAVMRAARALGALEAAVLARSHSGEVSGDTRRVVGYLAAAFGAPASS